MDLVSVSARCSTSTTPSGPSALTSGNTRRPNSFSPRRAGAWESPWIPSSRWAPSSPADASPTPSLSFDVRVNSYTEVESSILFSHVNIGRYSRIRRAIIDRNIHIPEGTEIGFDLEEDRKKYHVTETGLWSWSPNRGCSKSRISSFAEERSHP